MYLLGNVKELVVLLLFPNRLASREEHLDVLVEVSVLEELAVVLQEADQLLPGEEDERWKGENSPGDGGHLTWVFHLILPNHLTNQIGCCTIKYYLELDNGLLAFVLGEFLARQYF